jgi:hypothetical protein
MNFLAVLVAFDQRMLDHLEALCHKQQRFLGTSHYFWLRWTTVAHIVINGLMGVPNLPVEELVYVWIHSAVLLAYTSVLIWWEKKSLKRIEKGYSNPLRNMVVALIVRLSMYSKCVIIPSMMLVVAILDPSLLWYCLFICVYFVSLASIFVLPACDPLPPCTGKLREYLTSFFFKTAPSA